MEQVATIPAMLDREALLQQATARTGLSDFGDLWFLEPMHHYLAALNKEGGLTVDGAAAQSEVIVKGLANRLRMIDDIKRYPEILNEQVEVAGIILGLPRTGSTIFHRLLASAPGMTAIRWFEAQNYAPLPGEMPGQPVERRAYAQTMIDGWLNLAPELASIHPLDTDAPDEEILILGQLFVSTMLEGMSYVPSFTRWLNSYDQSRGHEDLKLILKYLQWQDPSRKGAKWILKSPSNLPYIEIAARAFPDALLIMTHRDPLEVVPSYVSMEATLYGLTAQVQAADVGRFWLSRLSEWMKMYEAARDRIGGHRFIDIDYREVCRAPFDQALRVLAQFGFSRSPGLEAALTEFISGNKREQRPMHQYSMEQYGLSEDAILREFASYRARLLGPNPEA